MKFMAPCVGMRRAGDLSGTYGPISACRDVDHVASGAKVYAIGEPRSMRRREASECGGMLYSLKPHEGFQGKLHRTRVMSSTEREGHRDHCCGDPFTPDRCRPL